MLRIVLQKANTVPFLRMLAARITSVEFAHPQNMRVLICRFDIAIYWQLVRIPWRVVVRSIQCLLYTSSILI